MRNTIREEKCACCEDGIVTFVVMQKHGEDFIGGSCDKCGYCCGTEQDKRKFHCK